MPQPSTILAHFTFCGSLWRWMCPLQYSSFWVKRWTHVSCHHGLREPICSSFKWLKKWKSTCKHTFLWISITFLGTHHAHTLLYPSCTWTVLGMGFTNHSSAMDKSWIVSWWLKKKTSSATCTVFTCSWSAGLKGVIFVMDASALLNSLHPLPKWCGFSTSSPNTSTGSEFQEWKCSAYINCHTTKFSAWQSFHYHYHCTSTYP